MNPQRPAVLIVDDEEGIHRALARTLRREPFELLHACDAAEAEAILGQRPDVRAVVCDHYMPGTLGLEFLMHVRRTRPGLVAILLTAQADIHLVLAAINEGRLHRFFTKPWNGDELRGALRTLLGLAPADVAGARDREEATEESLRRSALPERDEDGAWVIEAPDAGAPG